MKDSASRHIEGVEVRIADSGPGIAPELREQIFNPFVTTKKSGVGLGLSIVSKIIDGHHGSIRVESSSQNAETGEKRGACFIVFLPAATRAVNATQKEHLVIS
jgi:signal transduction histidine kinase